MSASPRGQALLLALPALLISAYLLTGRAETGRAPRPGKRAVLEQLALQPLSFEANEGQTDRRVRYLSRGSGYGLFLTADEAVLQLARDTQDGAAPTRSAVVRMRLDGANRRAAVRGTDPVATQSHYFLGNDRSAWRTGVQQYARVRYDGVYPGVDLVYYGNQRQLEYDFVVAPGADPGAIRLRFQGAERVTLAENGDLLLETPTGTLRQHRPVVYQEAAGRREPVAGEYRLAEAGAAVTFAVAGYDRTRPLVIDPVLSYAAGVGGAGDDYGTGIAVDAAGNAWVAGYTSSSTFPAAGAVHRSTGGGTEAFVARVSPAGSLLSLTFLGGSGDDRGARICLDGSGNAYLTGITTSTNFPTVAALQDSFGGVIDAFVTKLSSSGSAVLYSTYLGGHGDDRGNDICVDGSGLAYVGGLTTSADFPTTAGAFQRAPHATSADGFVSVLGASGNAFLYSTYLGGSGDDLVAGIVPDGNGGAYLTGDTTSTDFPLSANAYQRTPGGGLYDAYVAHLDPGGATLEWSTLVGGNGVDRPTALAVDAHGNCYIAGFTNSTSFPTANAFQPAPGGGAGDAFVTAVNSTGTGVIYSSYLGGSGRDTGQGIIVGPDGTASVVGLTDSANFPDAGGAVLGGTDAFVARIPAGGLTLAYATYLGGAGSDLGLGIAADSQGDLYVAGATGSQNFMNRPFAGGQVDAFAARLAMEQLTAPTNLVATVVSSGRIDLTWQDNSDNEDSFTIERRTGAGPFGPVGAAGANQTSYSDVDLAPLTSYTYRVRAASATGSSQPSNTASATTPAGPTPPSNLQANAVSTSRINLTWTDNSSDETGFIVERSTNGGLSFTQRATLGVNVTSYADTGLAAGTTYIYQVRAAVAGGYSAASNRATATTQPGPPAAPANLFAFAHTGGGVDLMWDDGSFNETGFKIERATGAAGAFSQIDVAEANAEAYLDTTAASGTQYRYRVRATNSGGDSAYSNIATITTPVTPPAAPTELAVTPLSRTQLRLTWTHAAGDATSFRIERKTGAAAFAFAGTAAGDQRAYTDEPLTAGTTYVYRVYARNSGGDSGYSNEASGTTPADPPTAPTDLLAAPLSRTSVQVTWIDRSSNEDSFRIERKAPGGSFQLAGTAMANSQSFTDTGLNGETTYTYRVAAVNSGGQSFSPETSATTFVNPPTGLTVTATAPGTLRVAWTDASAIETAYLVERSSNGTTFTEIGSVGANQTSYDDSGLPAGTTFSYRVRTTDGRVPSEYAGPVSGTTLPAAPSAPQFLSVSAVSSSSLQLDWFDTSNNETGFVVERRDPGGSFAPIRSLPAGSHTLVDTGLAPATQYDYRVKATNAGGESGYSNEASGTTFPLPPVAPANLIVTVTPDGKLQLAWSDLSSDEASFEIERKSGSGDFSPLASTAPDTTSYLDGSAAPVTTYTYRVYAKNAGGSSGYSNTAGATTPDAVPPAPTGLAAVVYSATKVRLTWNDPSNGRAQFRILRRTAGALSASAVGTTSAGTTAYLDSGLSASTEYTYSVKAFTSGGESGASNEVTVSIPTGGVLSISSKVNFGSRKIGTKYVKSITLKNRGKGTLSGFVDASTVTGTFRVLEGGGSFTLTRNQKKTIRVEFAPTAKARFDTTLRVTSSDPKKETVNVALYGKGK